MQTIRTMSLHSMMARRLAPGCCRELPRTPVFNQVICDAGGISANNAIHLSRPLMISVDLPGFRRPGDGKRSKDWRNSWVRLLFLRRSGLSSHAGWCSKPIAYGSEHFSGHNCASGSGLRFGKSRIGSLKTMPPTFRGVIRQEGPRWLGWVEEVSGVNAQVHTREEL